MQGILHASLLLLHLGLGRGADIDYSDTTGELGQTLLQFFAIIVRSGFLDLTPDLVNSALDIFGRTWASPSTKKTRRSLRAKVLPKISKAELTRSGVRSRKPLRTMIAKNCRSVWPRSPA